MFRQNDGLWYFKYRDESGAWKTYATHTRDEDTALELERIFKQVPTVVKAPKTVAELLKIYMDPERNPDYVDAKVTGRHYGKRHAMETARNMRDLHTLLMRRGGIGRIPLKKLTRFQCKTVMIEVHSKWGNTDKARKTFSGFKASLTYAADQGWIDVSPAQGMDDIKAEKQKEVIPMTPNDIKEIVSRPELFRFSKEACNLKTERLREGRAEEDYAMFCLLAMTGMRRAEAAALTVGQVNDGIYKGRAFHYIDINRAYKDDEWKEIGKPKWDLCRSIAITERLYSIISPFLKGKAPGDLVFASYAKTRFRQMFSRLKENAVIDGVEWEDQEAFDMLSPHKLRHALNTNLLAAQMEGAITETLVAEYLSWEHQDQSKMQRRYTNLVASRLIPVADMIENIYGYGKVVAQEVGLVYNHG